MGRKIKLDTNYRYGVTNGHRRRRIILLILVLALLVFTNRYIFAIRQISVRGNERVAKEEIASELGLKEGSNLFAWLLMSQIHPAQMNPLLSTVDVYIHWPSKVEVQVSERSIVGYVAWNGTYLCIDDAGYVVDSTRSLKENMPILTGIAVKNFALGEMLTTNSEEISQTAVQILDALASYGLTGRIVRVDLMELSTIRLFTQNLEIRIGNEDDMKVKVQALSMILEAEPDARGILHMEDLNGQVYLEKTY